MKTKVTIEATAKAGSANMLLDINIEGKAGGLTAEVIDSCADSFNIVSRFNFYSSTDNSISGGMIVTRPTSNENALILKLAEGISIMNAGYLRLYPEVNTRLEVIADVS